ncbi:MAG: CDP-diacylglycerol--serine O-phosphatidyltransferase [Dongiaceae bacterium]
MRRTRLRDHSINRLIPNMLTLFALCAGLTSIKFALDANDLMNATAYTGATSVADAAARKWELACIAIIVAAVFDALDGRIARLLDSTSRFGAELDSLSDFIAFGVAPSVILYVWTMDQSGRIGWGCTLLFSACMALRLARFNTKLDNADLPAWTSRFFTGVPAPAGAGLVLLPLIAYNEYGSGIADSPYLVGPWMVIVSGLLVSRIPTFSFKRLAINQRWVLPAMVIVTVFVALLASETWNTILACGALYLVSIPFSRRQFQRLSMQRPNAPTIDQRAQQDLDLH